MGETYKLANHGNDESVHAYLQGDKLTNWMTGAIGAIPIYLITSPSGGDQHSTREQMGRWACSIELLPASDEQSESVLATYTDLTEELFGEMQEIYEWFPAGSYTHDSPSGNETSVGTSTEETQQTEEQEVQISDLDSAQSDNDNITEDVDEPYLDAPSYILVNHAREEYVTSNGHRDTLNGWLTDAIGATVLYLTVSSTYETEDDMMGEWTQTVNLVGSYQDHYEAVSHGYSSITTAVFDEMESEFDWFPDAWRDSNIVEISNPDEAREALNHTLE